MYAYVAYAYTLLIRYCTGINMQSHNTCINYTGTVNTACYRPALVINAMHTYCNVTSR